MLVEQIEFADVVVINKASDVTTEQLATVKQLVASLNADARIVTADQSKVSLDAILNTSLFDEARAEEHPLWAKELYGFASHRSESDEYGIESFVYRARRPFDPAKFHAFTQSEWPGIVRAKGHFWLATRPDWVGELSQAGSQVKTSPMGKWWVVVPRNRWPDNPDFEGHIKTLWDVSWGDRRQELVFIGIGMNKADLTRRLDACLVRQTGFTPKLWAGLKDPFPAWAPAV